MDAIKISETLVFSLLLSLINTEAQVTYLYHDCPNTTIFSPNSTYQHNINTLLSSLSSNSTRANGFYNLTVGQGSENVVYGLFLCRGDDTQDTCKECVSTASQGIVQRCPLEKVALITYDECMLRYSNRNFFSSVQKEPSLQLLNTQQVSEPERFMNLLGITMNNVTAKAANDPSGKRFATAEANFSGFQTLYTLAQCTQDLSVASCNDCLKVAVDYLPSCCNGKQGGRVIFPSCNVRYELYPFYKIEVPPPSSSDVLPSPSPESKGKRKISTVTIIAITVPIVVSVMLLVIGFCYLTGRRKGSPEYDAVPDQSVGNEIATPQSLQFDLAIIQTATKNFSDVNKLGEGGYGPVYKGRLENGQEIAVKRLSTRSSTQGAEEFKNEVVLLAMLQHKNLVRLLGYCLEGGEHILIYEFVPNQSLDNLLFDSERLKGLGWPIRYKIIEGIARAILYLHEDSRLRIIHRDLKTSNILLDEDMNPKISDFGLARIIGADQSQDKTDRVVGTLGYMSPEYATLGHFSRKSDVYSFGVIILEIISGKKTSRFSESNAAEDLLSYAWMLWSHNRPLELLDPTLRNLYSRNEVLRCIHIGLSCVQEEPDDRPTMATIMLMLNSSSVTIASPQRPAFILKSDTEINRPIELESDQSASKTISWSVNEESISELDPR